MAPNDDSRKMMRQAQVMGIATGLAWSIVATLIFLIGGGILLDTWLGTMPLFTLIGVALGLICAAYELWELTRIGDRNKPAGPIGRQLERRAMRRHTADGDETEH